MSVERRKCPRKDVSTLTVTAQIRRRSRDRGALLQKGKKSKRTCHTRRSLAPSPALRVASLSRSFPLFLSFCPPVWSGPCVIGAESLRFGGTWTGPKKERSRASADSTEQHRASRYLAGSKIATALSSMVCAPLPPFLFLFLSVFLCFNLFFFFLFFFLVRGPLAASNRPVTRSVALARALHQFALLYTTRSLPLVTLCDRFPLFSSLTRSPAACISGCSEHHSRRDYHVDTATIPPWDNPENQVVSPPRRQTPPGSSPCPDSLYPSLFTLATSFFDSM